MRISARNQIRGKVTAIKEGAVEAQVTLDIGGGQKKPPVGGFFILKSVPTA